MDDFSSGSDQQSNKLPPRQKSSSSSSNSGESRQTMDVEPSSGFSMPGGGLVGALVGGSIGGIIGALIWGGIAYATGYHIGYVAIGVGFLVGLGAKMAAGGQASSLTGGIAAGLAILSVLAGKYFTAYLMFANMMAGGGLGLGEIQEFGPQDAILAIGYQIAETREEAGEELDWPEYEDDEAEIPPQEELPPGIYDEAAAQWNALNEVEKAEKLAAGKIEREEMQAAFAKAFSPMAMVRNLKLSDLMEPLDYLFLAIAGFAAFRVGGSDDED